MGIYILLSKLTPDGRKTLKERPHRIREVDTIFSHSRESSVNVNIVHQKEISDNI